MQQHIMWDRKGLAPQLGARGKRAGVSRRVGNVRGASVWRRATGRKGARGRLLPRPLGLCQRPQRRHGACIARHPEAVASQTAVQLWSVQSSQVWYSCKGQSASVLYVVQIWRLANKR